MKSTATKPNAAEVLVLLRIWQIVGDRRRGIEPLLPIGRSTFLERVRSGQYPQPVKLGPKTTAWKKSEILDLLESFERS